MIKTIDNPFKWIEHIKSYKTNVECFDETSWKNFNVFLINRSLSMYEDIIELVNNTQKFHKISNKNLYKIYCSKTKVIRKYEQYLKSKNKDNNRDELIGYISKYYECSNKESLVYLDILSKEDIKNILSSLAIDDKQIKKLLK